MRARAKTLHLSLPLRSGRGNDVTDSPLRAMNTCNFYIELLIIGIYVSDYRVPVRRKCNVYRSLRLFNEMSIMEMNKTASLLGRIVC